MMLQSNPSTPIESVWKIISKLELVNSGQTHETITRLTILQTGFKTNRYINVQPKGDL